MKRPYLLLAAIYLSFAALLALVGAMVLPAFAQQGLAPAEPPHTIARFMDMPVAPSVAALKDGLLLRWRGGVQILNQPLPAILEACDAYWGCAEFLPDGTCWIWSERVGQEWLSLAGVALDAFMAACGGARLERRGSVAAR